MSVNGVIKGKMKVYTKTTNDKPELPLAVADSKAELAHILGIKPDVVRSSFSHHRNTYHEVRILPELSECFTDNDGRLWYWLPNGGWEWLSDEEEAELIMEVRNGC